MLTIETIKKAAEAKGLRIDESEVWDEIYVYKSGPIPGGAHTFTHGPGKFFPARSKAIAAAKRFIDGWPYEPLTFEAVQAEAAKKGLVLRRTVTKCGYFIRPEDELTGFLGFLDQFYNGDALSIVAAIVKARNPKEASRHQTCCECDRVVPPGTIFCHSCMKTGAYRRTPKEADNA